MTLKVEYIKKISDYDLDTKQEVFYLLNRKKFKSEVFAEKIRVPSEYWLDKERPIDSLTSWRITPHKK